MRTWRITFNPKKQYPQYDDWDEKVAGAADSE